nr:uncharacterized protein LOC111413300 isoform X1 [Onthophagus taurus]
MMSTKRFIIFACLVSIVAGRWGFRRGGFRTGGSRVSFGNWGSKSSSSNWNSYSSSQMVTPNPFYLRSDDTRPPRFPTPIRSYASPTESSYWPTQRPFVLALPTPSSVVQTFPPVYENRGLPNLPHRSPTRTTPRTTYNNLNYNDNYNNQHGYPSQNRGLPKLPDRSPTRTTPRTTYNNLNYNNNYNNQHGYEDAYGGGYGGRPNYYNSYNSYSPYYTPSYSKYPNLYQPVGKYKNHRVRNSVIAGLGGSALGMYLGYKLGTYTSGLNQLIGGYNSGYNNPFLNNPGYNNGGSRYGTGFPQYSVVHHYHHGKKPIPQTIEVKENVIKQCGNDTNFCTPNTTPLCRTNGTIYCIAPISATSNCVASSVTHLPCLNTTISIPCVNASGLNCHNGVMLSETVAIPCVSNISVYGDFTGNKLQVHTFTADNSTADIAVTGQGIKNNFCVTVIADPVKIPKKWKNQQNLWYLGNNFFY